MSELTILYQDRDLVAIDKPCGLLVHRSPIDKHETEFAVQRLRDQIGQHVYPIHRLDRPTSGVLLFALSSEVASLMGKQLMSHTLHKRYTALVRGYVKGSGLVDYALRYRLDKYADKDRNPALPSQPACTEYFPLQHFELPIAYRKHETVRYTLMQLVPITGRKHQLRRHMAHLRHPIIGDTTHGDGKQNKFARSHFAFNQLALSCTSLTLYHPRLNRWLSIEAPMHSALNELVVNWQKWRT